MLLDLNEQESTDFGPKRPKSVARSELGATRRGGSWLNMNFGPREEDNESGRWPYLRSDNYGAGDIRRLITIASPFKGSPIANAAARLYEPPASVPGGLRHKFLEQNDWLVPNEIQRELYPGGVPDAPTAFADLATTSTFVALLSNNALFPTGRKAVAWVPFVGLATNGVEPVQTVLWELLFTYIPGLNTDLRQIEGWNPTTSDLVVPEASQRNNLMNVPLPPFEFHIHAGPVMDAPVPETASTKMSDKAGKLLSGPRTEFLTGGLGQ